MSQACVYTTAAAIDSQALQSLIQGCFEPQAWHFLRWPHRICLEQGLPVDFSAVEGQVFDGDRELRWRRQKEDYTVLILSNTLIEPALKPVGGRWKTQDLEAHFYRKSKTATEPAIARFPKELACSQADLPKIGQRYFIDTQTGTVQFVALRMASHD
jgi:hypothetical protein